MLNGIKNRLKNLLVMIPAGAGLLAMSEWHTRMLYKAMDERADDYLTNAPPGMPPENPAHNAAVYAGLGHPMISPRVRQGEYDANVLTTWQKNRRVMQGWPAVPPNYKGTLEEQAAKAKMRP